MMWERGVERVHLRFGWSLVQRKEIPCFVGGGIFFLMSALCFRRLFECKIIENRV